MMSVVDGEEVLLPLGLTSIVLVRVDDRFV